MKEMVRLGCDPELEVRRKRDWKYIGVERFGYDSCYRRVGTDGAGGILEIRPGIFDNENELIREIEKILRAIRIDKNEFGVYCWAETRGIGGHIHISEIDNDSRVVCRKIKRYIGRPMNRINDLYYKVRGSYRDWRSIYDYGGHIQYKSPPSYWLKSEEMARIIMKILRLIGEGAGVANDELVGIDDYIDLGLTESEAGYWMSNIVTFDRRVMFMDVRELWGIFKMPIEFFDTWDDGVKEEIEKLLGSRFEKVRMFGWGKNRGEVFSVAGFPVVVQMRLTERMKSELGWKMIVRDRGVVDIPEIGLPYSLRANGKKLDEFIEIIEEEVEYIGL